MELFHRKYGEGAPLIIVHGLYGASDNWVSIARALAEYFEVFIVDQRNHGQSPHSDTHDYDSMTSDLLAFMDQHEIHKAILLGHSMGGKTVMNLAIHHPERVNRLIVADIAPRKYRTDKNDSSETLNHLSIVAGMLAVDFEQCKTRQAVDEALAQRIEEKRIRQFLLKNIRRNEQNDSLEWRLNIRVLHQNMIAILDGFDTEQFKKGNGVIGFPVLFIRGQNSNYIKDKDYEIIQTVFPYVELKTIPNAGHWLHAEQPKLFIDAITSFIFD